MAKYTINFLENKSPEWKVASVTDEQGNTYQEVSINKTNKKGEAFPNFDGILSGHTIEANFWSSTAGKHYLFAPDLKNASTGQNGSPRGNGAGIAKAQAVKAENIAKSMDRKEESIAISSSMRDATLISTMLYKDAGMSDDEFKVKWRAWQKWIYDRHTDASDPTNTPPFN